MFTQCSDKTTQCSGKAKPIFLKHFPNVVPGQLEKAQNRNRQRADIASLIKTPPDKDPISF
jgi:hypothetical protein